MRFAIAIPIAATGKAPSKMYHDVAPPEGLAREEMVFLSLFYMIARFAPPILHRDVLQAMAPLAVHGVGGGCRRVSSAKGSCSFRA